MAPGPPSLPVVGHLPAFLRDKLGFLTRAAERYGDVVRLDIGRTTFLLNDPDAIHHVLVANHANYGKTPRLTSRRGQRLSGKGLLTRSGTDHLLHRRRLQPIFHGPAVAFLADRIVESADRFMDRWSDGQELDLGREMMLWAHRIMGRLLFSTDYEAEGRRLGDAVLIRRRHLQYVYGSLLPFPEYWPRPITLRYRRAMSRTDHALCGMIRERRRSANPPPDLLTMLIRSSDRDGAFMTDRQIRDEALTLSVTGYETLGEALAWTWWLLASHPTIEDSFRAHISGALPGRRPGIADLPRLDYIERVLNEALRLYPPTWIFVRIAYGEDTLPGGTRIPAGSKLYLCPYVTHRRPDFYPAPERFDPERFTAQAVGGRPRYAFFPFGGGPRVCIGESLGRMEGVLLLARTAQRARFELLPDQLVVPHPGLTLTPSPGIRVRVRLE
ncbi:MAG: cytochrome P450 [Gemmatimonadales bacterium]|nr:cytochrome P450 [Gemmatimonadales bacterium]